VSGQTAAQPASLPCAVITWPGRADNPVRFEDVPPGLHGLTLLGEDEFWTVAIGTREEILAAARELGRCLAETAAALEALA
jgi:hypothetical protein